MVARQGLRLADWLEVLRGFVSVLSVPYSNSMVLYCSRFGSRTQNPSCAEQLSAEASEGLFRAGNLAPWG